MSFDEGYRRMKYVCHKITRLIVFSVSFKNKQNTVLKFSAGLCELNTSVQKWKEWQWFYCIIMNKSDPRNRAWLEIK